MMLVLLGGKTEARAESMVNIYACKKATKISIRMAKANQTTRASNPAFKDEH